MAPVAPRPGLAESGVHLFALAGETMKIDGITFTIHFPKSDKNCNGDYYDVDVVVHAGERTWGAQYGDSYHEKGYERAEGFIDALQTVLGPKIPVLRIHVNDREDL
jgi:hypothetical protein